MPDDGRDGPRDLRQALRRHEGNQLWETIEGSTAGNGAPVQGTVTWTGGTERFAEASGEGTYEIAFSGSPGAGMYQSTGSKRGTLLLPGN